jgi:hypothetical protein
LAIRREASRRPAGIAAASAVSEHKKERDEGTMNRVLERACADGTLRHGRRGGMQGRRCTVRAALLNAIAVQKGMASRAKSEALVARDQGADRLMPAAGSGVDVATPN